MRSSPNDGWRGLRSGLLGFAVLAVLCPGPRAQDFRRGVQPLLEKYCYDCHGNEKTKADLNLEAFKDASGFYRDQRLWRQVITQVVAGEMPPLDTWMKSQPRSRSAVAKTTLCSTSQPPGTQSVAEIRTPTVIVDDTAARTASKTCNGKRRRLSSVPP